MMEGGGGVLILLIHQKDTFLSTWLLTWWEKINVNILLLGAYIIFKNYISLLEHCYEHYLHNITINPYLHQTIFLAKSKII